MICLLHGIHMLVKIIIPCDINSPSMCDIASGQYTHAVSRQLVVYVAIISEPS